MIGETVYSGKGPLWRLAHSFSWLYWRDQNESLSHSHTPSTGIASMASPWQPFREPYALHCCPHGRDCDCRGSRAGPILGRGLARWPLATLLGLWPSLAGAWVEVWFLHWLRPRLSIACGVQLRHALRYGSSEASV